MAQLLLNHRKHEHGKRHYRQTLLPRLLALRLPVRVQAKELLPLYTQMTIYATGKTIL
jgi:hypothetical protein